MDITEHLISTAKDYCQRRNLSPSRVSTLVMNDGKFLDRVAAGGGLTVKTYEKCLDWFAKQGHPIKPITIPAKRKGGAA